MLRVSSLPQSSQWITKSLLTVIFSPFKFSHLLTVFAVGQRVNTAPGTARPTVLPPARRLASVVAALFATASLTEVVVAVQARVGYLFFHT
jgi:hypothetical protein